MNKSEKRVRRERVALIAFVVAYAAFVLAAIYFSGGAND